MVLSASMAGVFSIAELTTIEEILDGQRTAVVEIADKLWREAELGYVEHASSKVLGDYLTSNGFSIERQSAGLPTAFVASMGRGSPVIGILAEFDALPGMSQAAVPEREVVVEKAAGHACGHNLFGAASVAAAVGLAKSLQTEGRSGTVRVYGTPAEEGGSGKVYMTRAG
jgi:aminobenzoyl-glutamate utilization protein B